MEKVDLLITNGWVITNDGGKTFVGDVAVKGGKIFKVGENLKASL